jgi:ATP-dependent DNA helicase PIF1
MVCQNPHRIASWRQAKVLIIDEVSMITADLFEKLDYVARIARRSTQPMGGLQVVACGDFFQLPPVVNYHEQQQQQQQDASTPLYCFESPRWFEVFDAMVEFKQVFRQSDPLFIRMLDEIRHGICSADTERRLLECQNRHFANEALILPTRLYTHNRDVDETNLRELAELKAPGRKYIARMSGSDKRHREALKQSAPVPEELLLKVGAQVMLVKNLMVREGLINGARGVVLRFDPQSNFPLVRFANGIERTLEPQKFTLESAGLQVASMEQIPLRLAWALT